MKKSNRNFFLGIHLLRKMERMKDIRKPTFIDLIFMSCKTNLNCFSC